MADFRLFQTERVCRRQFKFDKNGRKFIKRVENTGGKRRNCSLRAISPFPTVFSKDLYCRYVKIWACLGMGLQWICVYMDHNQVQAQSTRSITVYLIFGVISLHHFTFWIFVCSITSKTDGRHYLLWLYLGLINVFILLDLLFTVHVHCQTTKF